MASTGLRDPGVMIVHVTRIDDGDAPEANDVVTRRTAIRYAIVGLGAVTVIGGVTGVLAALQPSSPDEVTVPMPVFNGLMPVVHDEDPSRRFVLVHLPNPPDLAAIATYPPALRPAMDAGVLALKRLCPVGDQMLPFCASSAMFECPGCGSQFTAVGEHTAGPARRGMTLILVVPRADGTLGVTFDRSFPGVPAGTSTFSTAPAGSHCIGMPTDDHP
jgi:Rieske Fe-S protein